MKKTTVIALLLSAAGAASAQEYAPVLSKTPVVEHPVVGQSRLAGYQVTYSYQGQTYTVLMPSDPGSRVMIQTGAPAAQSAAQTAAQAAMAPAAATAPIPVQPVAAVQPVQPVQSITTVQPVQTVVSAPVDVVYPQPVYVESYPYYPYYRPWPVAVGIGIGFGWRGGWGHRWHH